MNRAPEDLAAFCDQQYAGMLGALTLYVGDRDVARELAQEAIIRACRDWGRVRRMDSPGGWLHQVGLNLARSYFRRKQAELRAHRRAGDPGRDGVIDSDPVETLVVRDAVAQLPARQRQMVILRFYLGYPLADIAALLGVTDGTVKSTLHHAAAALRAHLTEPDAGEVSDVS